MVLELSFEKPTQHFYSNVVIVTLCRKLYQEKCFKIKLQGAPEDTKSVDCRATFIFLMGR